MHAQLSAISKPYTRLKTSLVQAETIDTSGCRKGKPTQLVTFEGIAVIAGFWRMQKKFGESVLLSRPTDMHNRP